MRSQIARMAVLNQQYVDEINKTLHDGSMNPNSLPGDRYRSRANSRHLSHSRQMTKKAFLVVQSGVFTLNDQEGLFSGR